MLKVGARYPVSKCGRHPHTRYNDSKHILDVNQDDFRSSQVQSRGYCGAFLANVHVLYSKERDEACNGLKREIYRNS